MSNCAWMEWCADATSGTATSETANSARMLKRVIFAPEKKELRVESYTRRSTETNWAASPHFVVRRAAAAVSSELIRLHEQTDQTCRTLGVRHSAGGDQLREKFVARQARRQLLRIEVGRDDGEGVVVRRTWRRTGSRVVADALGAFSADVLICLFAYLALGEAG